VTFESQGVERKEIAIMRILSDSPDPVGARVTGIPYLMEAYRDEAMEILNS